MNRREMVASSWAFINAKTADARAFGACKGEPFANEEFLRVLLAVFCQPPATSFFPWVPLVAGLCK